MLQPQIAKERKAEYYQKGYWTSKTLLDYWQETVQQHGEREYITDIRGFRLTYQMVDDMANRLAAFYREQGVQAGDVIACQIPVWYEFAVVWVAGLKVGAVLNPLSVTFEKHDLHDFFMLHKPKLFVCPTLFRGRDFEAQIQTVLPDFPDTKLCLLDYNQPKHGTALTLAEILEQYPPIAQPVTGMSSDDVTAILCTSGSTGKSKGAMLTHNNIAFAELEMHKILGLNEEDVMFMPSPLNHATGFQHGIVAAMLHGSRVVLQERFEPRRAIALMQQEGCTYSMGATTFIYDILKILTTESCSLPKLRFYLCGGAPVPSAMIQEAWEQGIRLCEVYGSTESTPHMFVPPEEALHWNGTVSGRPMPGIEVCVRGENGAAVAVGDEGEECSRGPNVFVGYTNGEPAFDAQGWFHSGDLCVEHPQGYFRITGRKKDILIRGGENLNIHQLDENLEGCPGIVEHAITGMPDDRMGERICAFVTLQPDTEQLTLEQVLQYLREKQVPKWQWPERLEIVPALPKTDSGKIKYYVLRQIVAERLIAERNIVHE